jgi:hypothetical protein
MDPDLGAGYQINRQPLGHPDSGATRRPPTMSEMGGDPGAVDRPVRPALVLLVGALGAGGLVSSVLLYFWAGLLVAVLVGLVACALIGAAGAARRR